MRYFLILLCTLLCTYAQAQKPAQKAKVIASTKPQQNVAGVYETPEEKPFFPYGQDSLNRYIKLNIHVNHTDNKGAGRAVVVFIVETNGTIDKAEILSTSSDKDFDAEAVRVVKTIKG